MRWDDASVLVADRTVAAAGRSDAPESLQVQAVPRDFARRMLNGYMDGRELEAALDGIRNSVLNALDVMALSMLQTGNASDAAGSLHVLITQMVLQGLLVGSHPRGGGASQRPSTDFDGATE